MECYACNSPAARQCRRCARVYCEVHGGDLCAECLNPASALPSFNLYRGSLLAILVGSAVAIWLLVSPPSSGDSVPNVLIVDLTPPPIVTEIPRTPTPALSRSPTPATTSTPEATATPTTQTYTVQSGDTLISIANRFAPEDVAPFDYAAQIASANDIAIGQVITPGQTLVLP